MADDTPTPGFLSAFAYPSKVVMMVAQMVLGLAFFIGLVVKYYMLIFGLEGCSVDGTALVNTIRCISTLELSAHFVLSFAAIRFAACFFVDDARALLQPLMIAVVGILLLYLSEVTVAAATWSVAAVILAVFAVLAGVFVAVYSKFFVR